jgi:hypothetical protein
MIGRSFLDDFNSVADLSDNPDPSKRVTLDDFDPEARDRPDHPKGGGRDGTDYPATPVLDDVVGFLHRFVVLGDAQAEAIALWIAHTHAFEAADTTPYIAVTSAIPRSGKTLLLEVAELLVREPLPAANMSDAVVFRAIEALSPTLLLDEVDAIFGPKARDREDLRGLLCAGYKRGAVARRMGGKKMSELEKFSVFCAKAFALIGKLPETIADRTILIRLERKMCEEQIDRFRRRVVAPQAEDLQNRLADWVDPQVDELRGAWPQLPDELDSRAQDIWEPLLAIADIAGGDWPERARTAARVLSGPEVRGEDESQLARLLGDIQHVFEVNGAQRFRTSDLIGELCKIEESPWGDWFGKPITAHALSKLLQPFQIKTLPVWVDGKTVRGYKREQFEDAWARVLGVRSVRNARSEYPSQAAPNTPNVPNAPHADGRAVPGDDGFLEAVAAAHRNGQITNDEALDRERTHKFVVRGRT